MSTRSCTCFHRRESEPHEHGCCSFNLIAAVKEAYEWVKAREVKIEEYRGVDGWYLKMVLKDTGAYHSITPSYNEAYLKCVTQLQLASSAK